MLKKNAEKLEVFATTFLLNNTQKKLFGKYVELLEVWNKRVNLISQGDIFKIIGKHFWESLYFYDKDYFNNEALLLDIGSGGGFPGIPLKIMYPSFDVVLLDSKRKKVLFLKEAIESLGLTGAKAICCRVEDIATTDKDSFDIITARAVADLKNLWMLSCPLLKENGCLVSVKGGEVNIEIEAVKTSENMFDLVVKDLDFSQSLNDLKRIVLVKK